MPTKTRYLRVERPEPVITPPTKLWIPYEDGELAFDSLSQGPHYYQTVGRGILARNLRLPTGEQTAYLAQGAYESEESEFKEVQDIIRNMWLWVFNRNLWTPDGVYIAHDPNAVGLSQTLTVNELESMLVNGTELNGIRSSQDGSVRYAPRETYRLGQHTPESLASDGFVVASYGVNGAKALGEVAEKILSRNGRNPFTFGLNINKGEKSEQRLSALLSIWGDHGLGVFGNDLGDCMGGYALGVLEKGLSKNKI